MIKHDKTRYNPIPRSKKSSSPIRKGPSHGKPEFRWIIAGHLLSEAGNHRDRQRQKVGAGKNGFLDGFTIDGGFHGHGGTPIAGWLIGENPNLKWMIWRYPYFRKPPDGNMHQPVLPQRNWWQVFHGRQ